MNQPAREQLQIAQAARTIAMQMLEERGRGAVLVGVARVDAALERLLQAVLLPAPGSTDPFPQPDRPLGSFGGRISLAARLGRIDGPVEQALQTLRRVRNALAISTTTATLTDPAHAGRLVQAYAAARANALWAPLESPLSKAGAAGEPPVDPGLRASGGSGSVAAREAQIAMVIACRCPSGQPEGDSLSRAETRLSHCRRICRGRQQNRAVPGGQ